MSGFDSIRQGTFRITFDNGVGVSIHFAAGSYSDNDDLDFKTRLQNSYELGKLESSNAEVMITTDPTGKVVKWLERKHGDNPAGRLTPKEVLEVLKKAESVLTPNSEANKGKEK
jgi:hypothetical protein